MSSLSIQKVIGREILDSRGNPTVEAEVLLALTELLRPERRRAALQQANSRLWNFVTVISQDI